MSKLPDDIPFERWVRHVFDHPILEPQWYFHVEDEHAEEWDSDANPARTVEYLTRLFREPAFLVGLYSRAQVDQGLSYIVDASGPCLISVVRDETLPLKDRCGCIVAIASLYADLMAPVYRNDIAHLQQHASSPDRAQYACYMWWDIIPLYNGMKHPDTKRLNAAILHVFRSTLRLKAEACLESVLHGCGHWQPYLPDEIRAIVGDFLTSRRDISPAVRFYAELASTGRVQ